MAKAKTFGALLQWDNASVWTDIAQLARLGEVNLVTKEFVDCTAHDSAGGFREYLATLMDTDEFDAELQFDPADAGHTHLLTASVSLTPEDWRVVYPDAGTTTWEFTGNISKMTVNEATVDGILMATVTFKRTTAAPTQDPA